MTKDPAEECALEGQGDSADPLLEQASNSFGADDEMADILASCSDEALAPEAVVPNILPVELNCDWKDILNGFVSWFAASLVFGLTWGALWQIPAAAAVSVAGAVMWTVLAAIGLIAMLVLAGYTAYYFWSGFSDCF